MILRIRKALFAVTFLTMCIAHVSSTNAKMGEGSTPVHHEASYPTPLGTQYSSSTGIMDMFSGGNPVSAEGHLNLFCHKKPTCIGSFCLSCNSLINNISHVHLKHPFSAKGHAKNHDKATSYFNTINNKMKQSKNKKTKNVDSFHSLPVGAPNHHPAKVGLSI